ncbi:polynucleotide 3'-phosphatase ZDP isoform X2 [Mercurialis annua]|uniref:polynucleotide 3'-phosphatase ZDP isoform X2 n=1 Tax=Mercurialis annua TaxID=3986 RepID=UPI00215DE694|nr:polynucleotide 3'-phosphatase ZDP isoform X2 [Mercurialis annua]
MLTIFTLAFPTTRIQILPSITLINKPISLRNSIAIVAMPPSNSKPKIVAEYAKSNRSSCKTCSQAIPAKALRLGFIAKDASRGFDTTKWHHLDCVSREIESTEAIGGFASLQLCDQDALKKLISNNGSKDVEESPKPVIKRTREDVEEFEQEARNSKELMTTKENLDETEQEERSCKKTEDVLLLPNWKAFHTVIFLETDDGLNGSNKIAAFDFDGCLANTSVKRVGADAWKLMYPSIPAKLQSLYKDGYKLVIFTNESNIDRWKNKRQVAVDSKVGRLNNFIRCVNVPIQVFIACGYSIGKVEDPFRKPKPGMWQIMEKHFNSDITIDMDQSFYVGDAAGREKDHSDADIKFAQAIGLKFFLPEEYFET